MLNDTIKRPGPTLMRASHMLQNLASLRKLGGDIEAKVHAELQPDTVEKMQAEVRTTWLPIELDVDLTNAMQTVVGTAALKHWACDALAGSLEGPLLRPMLDGGLRIFGVNPHRLFGLVPRGFDIVYKNAGRLKAARTGPTSLELIHVDAPSAMLESRPYLDGMAGSFLGLFKIIRVEAEVEVKRVDQQLKTVTYAIRWTDKKS